jgi:aminodeoxyfutalosine synthase
MLQAIKKTIPGIHIKAFTAVELDYMISKAGMPLREGLLALKEYGLDSIPGGGAEILDADIRNQLCSEKATADKWIVVHRTAHEAGLKSNATMLYGHIEKYHHRISHLDQIRSLQDDTKGFNAFIPLKYRNENNYLSNINEVNTLEDLRNYAMSRIYLDNIDHIKSYWPMIGKDIAQLSLDFGVDDLDGTIDDSTKIYSMAGVKQNNKMSISDMTELIRKAKRIPVERDTMYNIIKIY